MMTRFFSGEDVAGEIFSPRRVISWDLKMNSLLKRRTYSVKEESHVDAGKSKYMYRH